MKYTLLLIFCWLVLTQLTNAQACINGVHFLGTKSDHTRNIKINDIASGRMGNHDLFLGYKAGLINTMSFNTNLGMQTMKIAGRGMYKIQKITRLFVTMLQVVVMPRWVLSL